MLHFMCIVCRSVPVYYFNYTLFWIFVNEVAFAFVDKFNFSRTVSEQVPVKASIASLWEWTELFYVGELRAPLTTDVRDRKHPLSVNISVI
jgi:hypothetical protein